MKLPVMLLLAAMAAMPLLANPYFFVNQLLSNPYRVDYVYVYEVILNIINDEYGLLSSFKYLFIPSE